mmetsp:Transcript_74400/g.172409  ORF Transcript_74400/g.172409 Transcript_74400/m.172409 type:complete len:689 (+) Transcript_74400:79-2145(+)
MALAETPDLVIRGGTIVDGTGAPPFAGDVAVSGSKIVAVGGAGLAIPKGRHEYDARGLVVAPGWVDAHTHFDGQVTWDPYLTPSTAGGVTTCIMGNCGVGFAPCQTERRDALINLVEAIEDVPGTAVHEGLKWEWETFEEYMNALDRRQLACDVAVMIGHSAVRSWVLGDRMNHADRPGGALNCPVQQHEVNAMAAVVRDAVAAGAIGFSTSRAIYHRDMQGVLMPGSLASSEEMLALIRAIGEGGGGVFGANMDFRTYDDLPGHKMEEKKVIDHWKSEWSWLNQIASESAGKINMTFEVSSEAADRLKQVERLVKRHSKLVIRTQCHARPQAFLQSANSRMNLLVLSTTYRKLDKWDPKALLAHMREPSVRSAIIGEAQSKYERCLKAWRKGQGDPYLGIVSTLCLDWMSLPPTGKGPCSTIFPWSPGCEPTAEESVLSQAERSGRPPLEVYYDMLVPAQGEELGVAWKPLNNYHERSAEAIRRVLEHPCVIPGVSDAGAHSGVFNDANGPTHLLTHWVRDRTRGPRLPIEFVVAKQTGEIARLFGLADRGLLQVGLRADINVIDLERLQMLKPFVADDLPTGATRWMQHVSGYRLTLVAGQETYRDGRATGLLPGRLVRNPKSEASAWRGLAHTLAWRTTGAAAEQRPGMEEYALRAAQGGGASAIARIARSMEDKEVPAKLRSRL